MTPTPRERFEEYIKEHRLGFITAPHITNIMSFIDPLLEEARQETKEKCLKCVPLNGGNIGTKIRNSIQSL